MRNRSLTYISIFSLVLLFWLAGCSRGSEHWLIGRWEMDMAATRAELQDKIEEETEPGSPVWALQQAVVAGVGMQQRELMFFRDGTVRAVVRGDPQQIPWPGGGAVLHEEEAEWQAARSAGGVLRVHITGGARQFADWRADLHFVNKDRFYYYTDEDRTVREFWERK